jgi:20S proteasome alpha/beta subunit
MAEMVAKVGIKKEKGNLYFVDKQGDISAATMARGGKARKGAKKVAKVGVKKQGGYLYFVDKKGNISRAKMARGGRKRKK